MIQNSNQHLEEKKNRTQNSEHLQSCGANGNTARTMARAERRFGMASIARSNAAANPQVSLELAISMCAMLCLHLRIRSI